MGSQSRERSPSTDAPAEEEGWETSTGFLSLQALTTLDDRRISVAGFFLNT